MEQFENLIRDKLKDFEAPENSGAWDAFNQKRLDRKKAINKKYFYSGLIGIVLVSIFTSIIIFNSSSNTEKREIVEKQIADKVNETNIVKTNTNSDLVEQNSTNTNKNSGINVENNFSNNENSIEAKSFDEEKHENNNIGVSEKDLTEKQENTNISQGTNSNTETRSTTEKLIDFDNIKIDYNIIDVCIPAKVSFSVKGIPSSYTFCWNFSSKDQVCNKKTIEKIYNKSGNYSPNLEIYDTAGNVLKRIYVNEFSIYSTPKAKINFENTNNIYTFSSQSENSVRDTWLIDNQTFDKSSLEYNFSKEGTHLVKLRVQNEAGCIDEDIKSVDITITHDYFIPNAFKPYSDGINSSFGPIGENLYEYSFKMLIFDKTGTMIFETSDIDNLWNGKINGTGTMAEPGVYTWEILTVDKNGIKKHKKGQVRLLIN